jgi:hypothetical protein
MYCAFLHVDHEVVRTTNNYEIITKPQDIPLLKHETTRQNKKTQDFYKKLQKTQDRG